MAKFLASLLDSGSVWALVWVLFEGFVHLYEAGAWDYVLDKLSVEDISSHLSSNILTTILIWRTRLEPYKPLRRENCTALQFSYEIETSAIEA